MNEKIFLYFYDFAHRSVGMDKVIVFFAEILPFIVIALAGLFLLFHHDVFRAENPFRIFLQKKKEILYSFFVGITAWILATLLKLAIGLDRPFHIISQTEPLFSKTDYSFPSGHATFFMALAFSIYFYHKKAGLVFITLAVLIGLARIAAGVHFPADILGGFILGALVAYFLKKYRI
jgi:undecaprenyl-diphosphatase